MNLGRLFSVSTGHVEHNEFYPILPSLLLIFLTNTQSEHHPNNTRKKVEDNEEV